MPGVNIFFILTIIPKFPKDVANAKVPIIPKIRKPLTRNGDFANVFSGLNLNACQLKINNIKLSKDDNKVPTLLASKKRGRYR